MQSEFQINVQRGVDTLPWDDVAQLNTLTPLSLDTCHCAEYDDFKRINAYMDIVKLDIAKLMCDLQTTMMTATISPKPNDNAKHLYDCQSKMAYLLQLRNFLLSETIVFKGKILQLESQLNSKEMK